MPFGSNDHNGEPTTTRKELANIAGTSEASVQRTKLILENGTRTDLMEHSDQMIKKWYLDQMIISPPPPEKNCKHRWNI